MWTRHADESHFINDEANEVINDLTDLNDIVDLHELTYGVENEHFNTNCQLGITESDEDDDDFQIVQKHNLRTYLHCKYCYICAYILLTVILIAATLTFIIVMVLILMPFVRTVNFQKTMCNVTGVSQNLADGLCSCGSGCDSSYACLHIFVLYSDDKFLTHNVSLSENELLLDEQVSRK